MPPEQRTFNTFIFDLDGTLLDTLPDLAAVANATLRECGYPERTTEEIKSFVGSGVRALIAQAVSEKPSSEPVDEALRCWEKIHPRLDGKLTRIYPGIAETVQELRMRGAKTAVLSNKYNAGVQRIMNMFLPELFDIMHGEGPDIPRKPDPAGLLLTMRQLGSKAEQTAYVGDSPGDIAAAHAAGVFAIGATWGYRNAEELAEAGADALIDSARELLRFAPSESVMRSE